MHGEGGEKPEEGVEGPGEEGVEPFNTTVCEWGRAAWVPILAIADRNHSQLAGKEAEIRYVQKKTVVVQEINTYNRKTHRCQQKVPLASHPSNSHRARPLTLAVDKATIGCG